jgi:hypothetical protein
MNFIQGFGCQEVDEVMHITPMFLDPPQGIPALKIIFKRLGIR